MENLTKALALIGMSADDIEALKAEKLPEGFELEKLVQQRLDDKIKLYNQQNPANIDERLNAARIAALKDIKKKLGRDVLKMDALSGKDLEDMDVSDFLKRAGEHFHGAIEKAGSGTDENLKKELGDYKQKFLSTKDELDEFKKTAEAAIKAAQDKAEGEIRKFKVNHKLDSILNSYEYGVPKDQLQLAMEGVRTKISSMPWQIDPDSESGNLSGPNPGDLAINFKGDGHFKSLKEATDMLVAPLLKKSNAGVGGEPIRAGGITVQVTNDAAKDALKRFEERNAGAVGTA